MAQSKGKTTIHMCCDRVLTGAQKIRAMQLAVKENKNNAPPPPGPVRRRFGASSMAAPAKMALEEDYDNFILMHAMGANTAGQLGSVIAGGLLLALVSGMI